MKASMRLWTRRFSRSAFAAAVAGWSWIGQAGAQNAPANQSEQAEVKSGSQIYMQARCFACHGQFGFGGAGPRFRENRFLGLTDYVVGQILVGRDIMPPYEDMLNDDQIAAVATFVRNSWGNQFSPVKPDQVASARKDVNIHPPQGRPHLPESPPPEQQPPPSGAK
jgi:mono/diheme cytochrome c family protein